MEAASGVTRSIIDELHSWDIQRDQSEGKTGVTASIIHEVHSWDIQGDEMDGEVVLLEVSFINFLLGISKEMK